MQFTYLLSFALALVPAVIALPGPSAATTTLTWSDYYDNPSNSVYNIACGTTYIAEGIMTLGEIPGWPVVGGIPAVTGSDDPDCGSCWKVTYTATGGSNSIYVTGIDNGSGKYIVSEDAMNQLTGGQAWKGQVQVTYRKAPTYLCYYNMVY